MEAPASEPMETTATAPQAAGATQTAGAPPPSAELEAGQPTDEALPHERVADPPADWPNEGPFDDPNEANEAEKEYVAEAMKSVLDAAGKKFAAEDGRAFAEAAAGGPATAEDDRETQEMLRYLDEESAIYAAGVAVDDSQREMASKEAARKTAGAPARPTDLESTAWKGGFLNAPTPPGEPWKYADRMRLLPPAPAKAAEPPRYPRQSAEEAAELEAEMAQLRVLAAAPAPAASSPAPAAPSEAPPADAHPLYERVQPGDAEAPSAARAPARALDALAAAVVARKKEDIDGSFFDALADAAAARAGERRKRKESGGAVKGAAATGRGTAPVATETERDEYGRRRTRKDKNPDPIDPACRV